MIIFILYTHKFWIFHLILTHFQRRYGEMNRFLLCVGALLTCVMFKVHCRRYPSNVRFCRRNPLGSSIFETYKYHVHMMRSILVRFLISTVQRMTRYSFLFFIFDSYVWYRAKLNLTMSTTMQRKKRSATIETERVKNQNDPK